MPIAMPFHNRISQDSTRSVAFNTLVSELGNNLRVYSDNGLNAQRDTWNINFGVMTQAEMLYVTNAFDTVGRGRDLITWTPIGENVSKNWILPDGYKIKPLSGNLYIVSATIEQEH